MAATKNPVALAGADRAWSLRSGLGALTSSEPNTSRLVLKELPSRARLARRWPGLRINRLTWCWHDDATGAKGEDLLSLLAFLSEGSRR
jgi:hypothetical protein